jgi:hypothetical protein
MCLLCMDGMDRSTDAARRLRIVQLLALIEHPDALSHKAALRISREIMAVVGPPDVRLRCDPVVADPATGEDS